MFGSSFRQSSWNCATWHTASAGQPRTIPHGHGARLRASPAKGGEAGTLDLSYLSTVDDAALVQVDRVESCLELGLIERHGRQ